MRQKVINDLLKDYIVYSTRFTLDVLNYLKDIGASLLETASTFNTSSPIPF